MSMAGDVDPAQTVDNAASNDDGVPIVAFVRSFAPGEDSAAKFTELKIDEEDDAVSEEDEGELERRSKYLDARAFTNLPDELDPEYYGEFTHDTQGRTFRQIVVDGYDLPDKGRGRDELLCELGFTSAENRPPRVVGVDRSFLWSRSHLRFDTRSRPSGETEQEINTWQNKVVRDSLHPWERYGPEMGLKYSQPFVGVRHSQMKGISFPNISFKFEIRLLRLMPSLGNFHSPLRGSLIVTPMYLHSCYKAIRHFRGNPALRGQILVDDKPASITKNLEAFLRQYRHPTSCLNLWIRDLCLNRENEREVEQTLTAQYTAIVENCSCGIIDMSQAMALLDDKGCLEEPPRLKEKNWDGPGDEYTGGEQGWHIPLPLQRYISRKREGLTEEDIAQWPDYEYVPLDLSAREIRLLNVYASEGPDTPIAVDIAHCPMYDEIQYSALSYTWGTDKAVRYIRDDNSKIAVTEYCYQALLQIRSLILAGAGPVVCWVDALCINQKDPLEKSRQIPRMHDIFENAMSVITSLGPKRDITDGFVDFLEHRVITWDFSELHVNGDAAEEPLLGKPEHLDQLADVYHMMRTSYFGRRWVVQEIASATHPVVIFSDRDGRAYRTLSLAAFWLGNRFEEILSLWQQANHPVISACEELAMLKQPGIEDYFRGIDKALGYLTQVKILDYMRQLRMKIEWSSFLFLAILTQHTQCSDPRDILNSLWNISKEQFEMELPYSYRDDVATCYTSFTKAYAQTTKSLDIICMSQPPSAAEDIESLGLPSWCPDFRMNASVSSLIRNTLIHHGDKFRARVHLDHAPYHADTLNADESRLEPLFKFEDDWVLAQGVILDTVHFTSSMPVNNTPVSDIDALTPTWFPEAKWGLTFEWDGPAVALEELDTDFRGDDGQKLLPQTDKSVATVLSDYLSMVEGLDRGAVKITKFESIEDGAYSYVSEPAWIEEVDGSNAKGRAAVIVKGRRLILTKEGCMGLAPWYVQKGYKLAIICGCSVPILLEEVDDEGASVNTSPPNDVEGDEDDSRESSPVHEVASSPEPEKTRRYRFRGDCFVQGWMFGSKMREYGESTKEAWEALSGSEHELCII